MSGIARLRLRLGLEEAAETSDGAGGADVAWQPVAQLWGRVEPLRGDERVAAGRIETALTHRVTVRHRPGVAPQMRFALGERRLLIRAVLDIGEARRFLECLCEETVP